MEVALKVTLEDAEDKPFTNPKKILERLEK